MFYIHATSCISPQQTFIDTDINILHPSVDNKLYTIEPPYENIPPGILRRMGKAVRMSVGAVLPIINKTSAWQGIIMATANGGNEESMKFLNQIIEYDEGILTPLNFVSGTPNAMAAQIGLLTRNHGYNITHVHRGLAFEYALIDAAMLLSENPDNHYLLGAADDISTGNYNVEKKSGSYKEDSISNSELYKISSSGSIAGEAAVMFLINKNKTNAVAKIEAIDTVHTDDVNIITKRLQYFLQKHLPENQKIDLVITGENGDNRLLNYYTSCEAVIKNNDTIARFKHMCGEYPTSTAMALWLACYAFQYQSLPRHVIKKESGQKKYNTGLIYNNYKGAQHSFILVSKGD